MPRLNSLGDALTGIAGGITGINGATPPSLIGSQGAGWDWLTDDEIIGQSLISGLLAIYDVVVSTDTLTTVVVEGANSIQAGGGVWEKWWTNGVTTNVVAVPSLPNAGTGDVDFDGTWAVCTTYATGSGITVYDPIGTVLQQINVSLNGAIRLRDGWLTYFTAAGWPIVDSTTGSALPGYVQQQDIANLIVFGATQPGLLEYNAQTAQFSIRRADQGTGLLLPISATMFGIDAVRLADGTVRIAWSTGQGEAPEELVVMDVDTSTGDTQVGTVVGGILVFTVGPTLEGSRFRLVQSPVVYPPYKDAMNVKTPTGSAISQPWVRYLNAGDQAIQSLQTSVSKISPPLPPATFDAAVFVSETATGFPLQRLAQDSVTVQVDDTVPGIVKWHVLGGVGQAGVDGIPGQDGEDGDQWGLPGPMGPQGPPGNTGPQGTQGTAAPGLDGEDGDQWGFPGPAGPAGTPGTSGNAIGTTAFGSEPGSPATGDVDLYTNSFYESRYSGSAWVPWGPVFPCTQPVDGDFAWINQGGATVDATKGGIYLSGPATATLNVRLRKKAAPATPYTITALILLNVTGVTNQTAGLAFRQSSDGKLIIYGVDITATTINLAVYKLTSPTVFSATYVSRGIWGCGPIFLRIQDNGTNRICSTGTDGQNFKVIHTVSRTDFLTADEVGFFVNDQSNVIDVGMTLISWKQT